MRLRAVIPKFRRSPRNPAPAPRVPVPEISAWHRVGLKYDVCRITRDGLRELAYDLYAAGAISLADLRLLSLEPVTYAPYWPNWNSFETPGESDGRRDWIDEVQARIRRGYPEHGYVAYQQSLLLFLERIEAARQEMLEAASPLADRLQPVASAPALKTLRILSSPAG
jgi:hypothetical protein